MLAEGVIEPSESPWSSPIVLAKKKDGKYRFCIAFQKVNEVTRKDAYSLPFIKVILDKLRRARYISTIDLKNGYWQVPLTPASKPITAFTVPSRGLYQFRVMPFGLHSTPELDPYCFAYLDDIVVLGETFEQHLEVHLRACPGELGTHFCETEPPGVALSPGRPRSSRDHPLSSGAKGFAAKLAPKYSGPYTVTKVLSPVVYNLQSPSGQKILRAHIKDLKPYQMPEAPADLANICRMPNQRIPPPPNSLQSVRQQLHRRLVGQADFMQAARRAALKIRERFRRAPRNPQAGRTETRTSRDVRSTSALPRPNPTPVGPTAGKPPRSRKPDQPLPSVGSTAQTAGPSLR
jgi:hypothetical protein